MPLSWIRVLCILPIQQRGRNLSLVLGPTIKCPCCQSRRLKPSTVLLVLETDWVNLNPTMAPINSSLGTVMGVRDATCSWRLSVVWLPSLLHTCFVNMTQLHKLAARHQVTTSLHFTGCGFLRRQGTLTSFKTQQLWKPVLYVVSHFIFTFLFPFITSIPEFLEHNFCLYNEGTDQT